GAAEMAEHETGTSADHDCHAGNHREGCKETTSHTPSRQEARKNGFAVARPKRHRSFPRPFFIFELNWMRVSLYPVNKVAKVRRAWQIFVANPLKKAGISPALF